MKRSIVLIALIALPLILKGQYDSIISIQAGIRNIEGTMLFPESKNDVPMVLIIPGSGPIDRDGNHSLMNNNSLKMLAEGLFDNGIASLRYDKRGVKGNPVVNQKEADIRFEDFVQDARYWISNLRDLNGIGPVHVLGHSQGSLVAIIAAQGTDVRSVISLAGGGLPLEDVIRIQLEVQAPVLQEHANIILDSLRQGQDVKRVHPMLQSLFRPSLQPFIRSWMQYDPRIEIATCVYPEWYRRYPGRCRSS